MIDHAKFFMQVCVIAQHHLSSVLRSGGHTGPLLTAVILWENSFAMPLFAFFSGFTSKSDVTPARARKTLVNASPSEFTVAPTEVPRDAWKIAPAVASSKDDEVEVDVKVAVAADVKVATDVDARSPPSTLRCVLYTGSHTTPFAW